LLHVFYYILACETECIFQYFQLLFDGKALVNQLTLVSSPLQKSFENMHVSPNIWYNVFTSTYLLVVGNKYSTIDQKSPFPNLWKCLVDYVRAKCVF